MKKLYLLVLITLSVFVSSCGEKKSDVLVVGTASFNGDFYSGWTNSSYDNNIRKLVWGHGLMGQTRDGEIVDSPLVESKTIEGNKWTFKLVDGLEFSNGNPLTVKDVKFTYDFYMDEEALAATGGTTSLNQYVESVEIDEDSNTVEFNLAEMIFTIDASVFTAYLLDSATLEAKASEAGITVQQYVKANINSPIGYGPYKIVEYVESQYVKLEINDKYTGDTHGDKPGIKTLIVQSVPSETEVTQLLSEEIDVLAGLVSESKIEAVVGDENISTNNYFRHGGGQITFHCDYGPAQLREVRQAFAYQFDRIKFRNLFLGKYGISSNAPYSRNQWMMYDEGEKLGTEGKFEKSLQSYDILDGNNTWDKTANVEKARNLLDAAAEKTEGEYAKLTKDASGNYLWEGEELALNLAITSQWSDAINLTLPKEIQEEFGIKVNVESIDWSVMASHLYGNISSTQRKYHMFTGGTSYAIKSDPYANWSATKIFPYGQGSSPNSARYSSDEQLLDDIRFSDPTTEEGIANYKDSWRKWLITVNQELPLLPLYSNNYYDAYNSKLVDFETNALWDWPMAIVKARLK